MKTVDRSVARWPAVAALDRCLNHHILGAQSPEQMRYWWNVKMHAKRVLDRTADGDVEAVAPQLLASIRQEREAA